HRSPARDVGEIVPMNFVADTHALIWHFSGDSRLSSEAKRCFAMADQGEAVMFVSVITVVEVIYLDEKGKVSKELSKQAIHLLKPAEDASYRLVPIDYALSLAVASVSRTSVPELSDRIIAATAYHLHLPLITKDKRIHDWKGIESIW